MELRPNPGAKKRRSRKGRGIAAGQGKTCGRGTKGQKARTSVHPRRVGQMSLVQHLPKLRGQGKNARNIGIFRKHMAHINVGRLNALGLDHVTPQVLVERRIIRSLPDGLKVLGEGEMTRPIRVEAHAFSATALDKIRQAGGEAVKI